jgi:hypothetical protein
MAERGFRIFLAFVLAAVVALPACSQVHVRRGNDGVLRITDQDDGGSDDIYGMKWQRRNRVIEAQDPASGAWVAAPADYQNVITSGSLLLAYGPKGAGCCVFDASRKIWTASRAECTLALVSENLAVGYGDEGKMALYNRQSGRWATASFPYERLAITDSFLVAYGPKTRTAVFDSSSSTWVNDNFNSFDICIAGNYLAVLYRRDGGGCTVYDSTSRMFVSRTEAVETAQVTDRIAVIRTTRGSFSGYCTRAGRWTSLGQARSYSITNGEIRAIDTSGNTVIYRPSEDGFQTTYAPSNNYNGYRYR